MSNTLDQQFADAVEAIRGLLEYHSGVVIWPRRDFVEYLREELPDVSDSVRKHFSLALRKFGLQIAPLVADGKCSSVIIYDAERFSQDQAFKCAMANGVPYEVYADLMMSHRGQAMYDEVRAATRHLVDA